jgi:hypothetical protein
MYALVLAPVLAAAFGIGYYKFILPSGVAAEVNGEVITVAELDALVKANGSIAGVPADMQGRVRYAALSELITERVALQEARSAGVKVSEAELQEAIDGMRAASGLDEKAFEARVTERYGSMKAFRKGLELRLVLRKFVDEKVTAGARDAADANDRMNRWLQGATAKASVRIALEEQLPSSGGCGCCSSKAGANGPAKQGCDPKAGAGKGCDPARGCGSAKGTSAGAGQVSGQGKAAQDAALAYWQKQNGAGPVETKVTDFGCHVQVDIIANKKVAKSLRYQNGTITEM